MQNIVDKVYDAIINSGLVQIEISARHVHLSSEHLEILFGKGKTLTPKRELSQPGQYLSEERVTIIGAKRFIENVAVLGPVRKDTQVEISRTDALSLGVNAPIRESGDVRGSAPITIKGPAGEIQIKEGVIIAKAHIHITPEIARNLSLKDNGIVMVEVLSDRPVIYKEVVVRVSDKFNFRMHIDFDEANSAGVGSFTLGKIIS